MQDLILARFRLIEHLQPHLPEASDKREACHFYNKYAIPWA